MSGMSPEWKGGLAGAGEGAAAGAMIGGPWGALIGAAVGAGGGALLGQYAAKQMNENSTPTLAAPKTAAPTPQVASTTAIQSQLSNEQNARASATIQTGPSGLTDEPTTTSSLLTGV